MRIRFGFLFVFLMFISSASNAAPDSKLLKFWDASDETSTQEVSHAKWQSVLAEYLVASDDGGVNLFDYQGVSTEDRQVLQSYLEDLQNIDPRELSKAEQFAYWVNMYNALTIEVVLEEYPVKSIRSIRFLSSPFGPWDKNFVEIVGQKLSLNDIEHRILRPIWDEPRIHFAVNCASIGCPNLMPRAFTAANTEELLEIATNDFIGHPRGFDLQGDALRLSSIFDWYGSDFGSNQAEINEYLGDYVADDIDFDSGAEYQVSFDYDWSLNEVKSLK